MGFVEPIWHGRCTDMGRCFHWTGHKMGWMDGSSGFDSISARERGKGLRSSNHQTDRSDGTSADSVFSGTAEDIPRRRFLLLVCWTFLASTLLLRFRASAAEKAGRKVGQWMDVMCFE